MAELKQQKKLYENENLREMLIDTTFVIRYNATVGKLVVR